MWALQAWARPSARLRNGILTKAARGGRLGVARSAFTAPALAGPARCCEGRRRAAARSLSRSSAPAYEQAFASARDEPDHFWSAAAQKVTWFEPCSRTLDESDPVFPKWFVGGKLNVCFNAVDRHVENGRGGHPAIIYDSPVARMKQIITYAEVQEQVSKLAGVLVKHGVKTGDLVVIYMPMIPQAMFAMLACARIGAPHSLIFGGFASRELSVRIDHAKPKMIVTASFGIEPGRRVEYIPLVQKALEMSTHKPQKVLIYNRPGMVSYITTAMPHCCMLQLCYMCNCQIT